MAGEGAPLRVSLLRAGAVPPRRGSAWAAGYDLAASAACVVPAASQALVETGLVVMVPLGTYGRVAPRSGLAVKHGITVGAGVVDADYRGELMVVLFNHSKKDFAVAAGDRVAQLVLERIVTPAVELVAPAAVDATARGAGAFGSTGTGSAPAPAPGTATFAAAPAAGPAPSQGPAPPPTGP